LRTKKNIILKHSELFVENLLNWAQQFDDVAWLDSNNYNQEYTSYDAILAVDAFTSIQTDYENAFDKLKEYQSITNDWIFGYLTYDLKNDVEELQSNNFDGLHFPDLYFFQPKKLFLFKGNTVEIQYLNYVANEIDDDIKAISNETKCHLERSRKVSKDIKIKLRIHKDDYFKKINSILKLIHRGNIYEANFCQEFYAESTSINPLETYKKLNTISYPPFATFLKCNDKYLLSASPERLSKKRQEILLFHSQ